MAGREIATYIGRRLHGWPKLFQKDTKSREAVLSVACSPLCNKLNAMNGLDGMSHAQKPIIRCGFALNTTGRWEIEQVSSDLQSIVNKCTNEFVGVEAMFEE